MGRGPPGEAGLAAGVAVRGRTQHDGAPVGPVRTQRAERGRLRAEAGPPADVRVAFAQDSGAGAGSRWGTAGLWGVGVVRDDAILARRVLLVPVGDVEPLQGRLDAQLVFAQVGAGFVRLLEFVLRGLKPHPHGDLIVPTVLPRELLLTTILHRLLPLLRHRVLPFRHRFNHKQNHNLHRTGRLILPSPLQVHRQNLHRDAVLAHWPRRHRVDPVRPGRHGRHKAVVVGGGEFHGDAITHQKDVLANQRQHHVDETEVGPVEDLVQVEELVAVGGRHVHEGLTFDEGAHL
uniref:(northern house mosquito) hypothetical protein n=1 Tax=Culex pipiens TaxID=7175 RepID=A0A8D8CWK7_CULPI